VRVLIVEDTEDIAKAISIRLENAGHAVDLETNGADAIDLLNVQTYDLVILDLTLPGCDGLDVLRNIRSRRVKTPVLVLTARSEVNEKISALDLGADDYLTKPFGVGELLARMRVALRHATLAASGKEEPEFVEGDLRVDLARRQVFVRSQEVHLTPLEYRLLQTLVHHAGKVVTHRHLLKEVWGINSIGQNHYLRVYMTQLRHKLEADPTHPRLLLTEPGVGYRLKVSG